MMNIPNFCIFLTRIDKKDAGWYVPNSIVLKDIVPSWRSPGGGVFGEELTKNLKESLDRAIRYTKNRISDAERHLSMLEKAREEQGEQKN